MDETDSRIISALKEDSRLSVIKLAKKLRLPVTTVHYRFTRMQQQGVLKFTVRIDRKFLGRELVGFVLVKAMPGVDHRKLFETVIKHECVEEGAIITGEFDILVKICVTSMKELDGYVLSYLRKNRNIAETRTMLAYSDVAR